MFQLQTRTIIDDSFVVLQVELNIKVSKELLIVASAGLKSQSMLYEALKAWKFFPMMICEVFPSQNYLIHHHDIIQQDQG